MSAKIFAAAGLLGVALLGTAGWFGGVTYTRIRGEEVIDGLREQIREFLHEDGGGQDLALRNSESTGFASVRHLYQLTGPVEAGLVADYSFGLGTADARLSLDEDTVKAWCGGSPELCSLIRKTAEGFTAHYNGFADTLEASVILPEAAVPLTGMILSLGGGRIEAVRALFSPATQDEATRLVLTSLKVTDPDGHEDLVLEDLHLGVQVFSPGAMEISMDLKNFATDLAPVKAALEGFRIRGGVVPSSLGKKDRYTVTLTMDLDRGRAEQPGGKAAEDYEISGTGLTLRLANLNYAELVWRCAGAGRPDRLLSGSDMSNCIDSMSPPERREALLTLLEDTTEIHLSFRSALNGSKVAFSGRLGFRPGTDFTDAGSLVEGLTAEGDLSLDASVFRLPQYGLGTLEEEMRSMAREPGSGVYDYHIEFRGGHLNINSKQMM
mgnify:CR=1 FL=1